MTPAGGRQDRGVQGGSANPPGSLSCYFKRFAHSPEPNCLVVGMLGSWVALWFSSFLVAVLLSCCLAAALACLLKKLKNCSNEDPKLSPEGPKMTRKLSQNEEKKESGFQNYPREVPGEI